jgi:hypothetical protein
VSFYDYFSPAIDNRVKVAQPIQKSEIYEQNY